MAWGAVILGESVLPTFGGGELGADVVMVLTLPKLRKHVDNSLRRMV